LININENFNIYNQEKLNDCLNTIKITEEERYALIVNNLLLLK